MGGHPRRRDGTCRTRSSRSPTAAARRCSTSSTAPHADGYLPAWQPKDPEVFRRTGRAETAAAALVWTVGKANDLFEQRPGGMQVRDLMSHFGLGQSSVATACRHHVAGRRILRRHLHCATRLARLSGGGSAPTDHHDARQVPAAGRRDDLKPRALVQFERLPQSRVGFRCAGSVRRRRSQTSWCSSRRTAAGASALGRCCR